jgi:hypothetical protein
MAVGGSIALSAPTTAFAGSNPPYEPDPQSVGSITFYDASGNVVTSGTTSATPMVAYAVGSATIHQGDTTAVLIGAQPKPSATTANWNTDFLSSFTSYPITSGAPAAIQTLSQTKPVVTGANTDLSLADFIAEFPNTSGADANLYQLRLKTASGSTQTDTYDVADVQVSGSAWTEVYPTGGTPPTSTSTSLSVSRTSAKAGQSVTLTATETPHAAGHIQFQDNGSSLGSAVTVSNGTASLSKALSAGSNKITAVFTPSNPIGFSGSTSSAKTVTVTKGKLKNTGKPKLKGPHKVGKKERVKTGSWSPHASKFSYQWYLGSKKIKHATKKVFKPVSKDAGKKLKCKVTAKKAGFASASATTKAVKVTG